MTLTRTPRPLTQTQIETLTAIAGAVEATGRGPTLREIAARRGVAGPGTVHQTVEQLHRLGLVTRNRRDARSTRLTPEGYGAIGRPSPVADAALGRALRMLARRDPAAADVLARAESVA